MFNIKLKVKDKAHSLPRSKGKSGKASPFNDTGSLRSSIMSNRNGDSLRKNGKKKVRIITTRLNKSLEDIGNIHCR